MDRRERNLRRLRDSVILAVLSIRWQPVETEPPVTMVPTQPFTVPQTVSSNGKSVSLPKPMRLNANRHSKAC